MLDHFAVWAAREGLGILGETIFCHEMPVSCEKGILFRYPLEGVEVDPYLPGNYFFGLEVIIRAPRIIDGDELARRVQKLFTFDADVVLNDVATGQPEYVVRFMHPQTLPRVFPRLEGNGREWSITFDTNLCEL